MILLSAIYQWVREVKQQRELYRQGRGMWMLQCPSTALDSIFQQGWMEHYHHRKSELFYCQKNN